MKVTVTTLKDDIFVIDVSEDLELENFKAFCEIESGFPSREITLICNSRPMLNGKKSLKEYGLKDGDVVVLLHMLQSGSTLDFADASQALPSGLASLDFSSIQVPNVPCTSRVSTSRPIDKDPRLIRKMILENPKELALLKQNNPLLADALLSGNLETFKSVLHDQMAVKSKQQQQVSKLINSDPFDAEAQLLIAEEIKRKNINSNMEAAMEYNPETFGTVVMLYINCYVNGYLVKAFIDSGAQTTLMSSACAKRCHIKRLIDTRWPGIARGVGTQIIIGRIHMVQLRIEGDFLTTSFAILEEGDMDMLLGLDILRRYQCSIDLKRNVLLIGTTGTETSFLPESELPQCALIPGAGGDDSHTPSGSKKTRES